MTIAEILAKLAKGEELTDAEKKVLGEYNHQKTLDDAAAAARRKAEERQVEAEKERDVLKARVTEIEGQLATAGDAGKSDVEKLQGEVKKLTAAAAEHTDKMAALTEEKRVLVRTQKLADLQRASGITFVEGMDPKIMGDAFGSAFKSLQDQDLDDEAATKPLIEAFRTTNKAAIAAPAEHGAGNPPHDGTQPAVKVAGQKTPDKQTDDERAAELRKQSA